jgi:hypothetical protein
MSQDAEPESLFQALEGVEHLITPSKSLSLAAMLRIWASDVRRFIGGIQSTPIRDAVIWSADDYIGALTMRSMIEQMRRRIPIALEPQFDQWLVLIDTDYQGFTRPDDEGLLANWIHEEVPSDWWWHRVPRSGPVLEDLLR